MYGKIIAEGKVKSLKFYGKILAEGKVKSLKFKRDSQMFSKNYIGS